MPISSKQPDRSRLLPRSPITAPCQVVPQGRGFARKCSSPVFTSSPVRNPVKRALPRTPENHHKENAQSLIKLPVAPSPSPGKQGVRAAPGVTKPKKILGERNDDDAGMLLAKKCRKGWQIPSSSQIELKESLSGMDSLDDGGGCAVDQDSFFPVNREVLEQPEPVAAWVQERSTPAKEAELKTLVRDLFRDEEQRALRQEHSPQHSSSGSSSHGTVACCEQEEEMVIVETSVTSERRLLDRAAEEKIIVSVESNDFVVEEEKNVACIANELLPVTMEEKIVAAVEEMNIASIESVAEEASKPEVSAIRKKPDSSRWGKSIRAFGFLALLFVVAALAASSQEQLLGELRRRSSEFRSIVSAEVDWSSEADTIGLHVDPELLQVQFSAAKRHLLDLYERSSASRSLEKLGVSSVKIISSYYSSLVLGNHAKDVLFNYCLEFQGQYYRLRMATISLIEQAIPLEAAARDVVSNWSFDDALSKTRSWFTSAENYANEALVHRYLRLPALSVLVKEASGLELETLVDEARRRHINPAPESPDNESDLSPAADWIGDAISMCRTEEDRFEMNPAQLPLHTAETTIDEDNTETAAAAAAPGSGQGYVDRTENLYIGGAVLAVATMLGLAASYGLRKNSSKRLQECSTPESYVISAQEILRMRGADEELVLTPEQESGSHSPYGSFTAYKRVVYNEGSEKEEVKLTPVRRSSRIRNQVPRSFN